MPFGENNSGYSLYQGPTLCFCKGPERKQLRLCGHTVSVPTTRLCCCGAKGAVSDMCTEHLVMFQEDSVYKSKRWAGFGLWAVVCIPLLDPNLT